MGIPVFVATAKEGSFTTKLVEAESEHAAEFRRDARTVSSLHSYRTGIVQVQHGQDIFCAWQTSHHDLERTMLKVKCIFILHFHSAVI